MVYVSVCWLLCLSTIGRSVACRGLLYVVVLKRLQMRDASPKESHVLVDVEGRETPCGTRMYWVPMSRRLCSSKEARVVETTTPS